MRLPEFIRLLPAIIADGARMWTNVPRRPRWRFDPDGEERERRYWQEQERWQEELHGPDWRQKKGPVYAPRVKKIHLILRDQEQGDLHETVAIDLDRRRIDTVFTGSAVFGYEHRGFGAIGVIIFSMPFLLPIAPILLAVNGCYALAERLRGMSRHHYGLLKTLRGQLDAETESLLVEAFKNEWSEALFASQKYTLDEAGALLDRCDQVEHVVTEEEAAREGGEAFRQLRWYDERGEPVAEASFYRERDHYVQVGSSTFHDADADRLVGRRRSHRFEKI